MFFQNSLPTPFSTRMEEILEELRSLRQIIATLQPSDSPCQGVTGKGTQCRNRAVPGGCHCRMHGERVPKVSKVERVPKVSKKVKKVQPEHTHGIGEVGVLCPLCVTHGDVWDPVLTECEFVGDDVN